jgi:histidyl-tRNA synthetase
MITLVKGFHDILPDEARKRDFLVRKAETTLEAFGYRKIIPPVLERTELFRRGIGAVTDIVEKEMYTFEDRGGQTLSLRPEATAGILRAVVEHSLLRKEPVLKLFTIGPMFRRERPSKGRFRQFFQVNAEVIGDDSPLTDAETIAAAHATVREMGANDLMMEINSLGCRDCRAGYRAELQEFLMNRLDDLCEDCQRRYHTNPLRVLDCKVPRCVEAVKGAPIITDSLDDACRDHFSEVRRGLDLLGIPYRLEPGMVRGLDYYTRTAFEIVHQDLGRSKAVGGGGRYDSLIHDLGGPEASGIGFAIGLERLAMGITDDDPRFTRRIDAFVAVLGENAQDTGFKVADRLRKAQISTEARYSAKSLKAQLKVANRIGAARVIMIGDDELERGQLTVRDMDTKEQTSVEIDEIVSYFKGVMY